MPDAPSTPALSPGATYRFVVRNAEEAVQTIRERLGPHAKVLSVRQLDGGGLGGLFSKPKLEVVAQVGEAPVQPVAPILPTEGETIAPANFAGSSLAGIYAAAPAAEQVGEGTGRPSVRPTRDSLPGLKELLRRSGFSEQLLARLESTPALAQAAQLPLHQGLVEVAQALRAQAGTRKPRPLPSRTAFLGTPGVGRTTALCKWLAKEVFVRERVGRVLKAEFDRPNPAEGLAVFCEALGISLEYYSPEADAAPETMGGAPGEFLYADLPGISVRNPAENAAMAAFLNREKFAGRVLVLNAAYDASALRRGYAAGSDLGATHVVFTHLDEIDHWGKLWDLLLDGPLTPLFLATGPSLTGDCEDEPLAAVLRKTIPGG